MRGTWFWLVMLATWGVSVVATAEPNEELTDEPSASSPNTVVELPAEIQFRTLSELPLSESELRAKVEYAELMLRMAPAKRIFASDHEQAKALLEQARNKSAAAQHALENGKMATANELVNQCYRTMAIAARLVPSPHQIKQAESQNQPLWDGLEHAKELYQQAYQRQQDPSRRVEYDAHQVYTLEQQAKQLIEQHNYSESNHQLEQARMLVDLATMAMLDKQTVVYEVDVSTPEKEFAYEEGRFVSYEELIPVAIEMKRPNKMQLILINRRTNKGEWMAEQARLTAKQGDYPRAIRMIMDASAEVRKALKLMKVKVYE